MGDLSDDDIWLAVGVIWSAVFWFAMALWVRFAIGHFWLVSLTCGLIPWIVISAALKRTPKTRRDESLQPLYRVADLQISIVKDVLAFVGGITSYFLSPGHSRRRRTNFRQGK